MGKSHTTSPYKQGLEKGQGRNEVSPFKGIDTFQARHFLRPKSRCRNEVSPFKGIDTLRNLQQMLQQCLCRNEVSPFKGIDTQIYISIII